MKDRALCDVLSAKYHIISMETLKNLYTRSPNKTSIRTFEHFLKGRQAAWRSPHLRHIALVASKELMLDATEMHTQIHTLLFV